MWLLVVMCVVSSLVNVFSVEVRMLVIMIG